MQLDDFAYYLPEESIAQHPMKRRDESNLMVVDKVNGNIENKKFKDIVDYLNKGDCLVLNDTKVIPARLFGNKKNSGGKIEFLLLKRIDIDTWEILVKPGRKAKIGSQFVFGSGQLEAKVIALGQGGTRIVKFQFEGIFEEILDKLGNMPLPPYITEQLEDKRQYQTVYSKNDGSSAAPTAGLHFTEELLDKIEDKGVNVVFLTLHVGLGTFRPVKVQNIYEHNMHSEYYSMSEKSAEIINKSKKEGNKIIAVGTTSTRTLETLANEDGSVNWGSGWTDIFIYPGYKYKVVDSLITNFHLPQSTLLMLVSAFSSREIILNAYNTAIDKGYRFYSFGDAMLLKH